MLIEGGVKISRHCRDCFLCCKINPMKSPRQKQLWILILSAAVILLVIFFAVRKQSDDSLAPAPSAAQSHSGWQTFRSDKYGFSMEYPQTVKSAVRIGKQLPEVILELYAADKTPDVPTQFLTVSGESQLKSKNQDDLITELKAQAEKEFHKIPAAYTWSKVSFDGISGVLERGSQGYNNQFTETLYLITPAGIVTLSGYDNTYNKNTTPNGDTKILTTYDVFETLKKI